MRDICLLLFVVAAVVVIVDDNVVYAIVFGRTCGHVVGCLLIKR